MGRFGDYPEYVPVSVKKEKAQRQIEKLRKKNPNLAPIIIEGRTIARTWWGKAWNDNLELYADYSNRLARGRSYIRSGAVLDLQIDTGRVTALVQGSRRTPYTVQVQIDALSDRQLESIAKLCDQRIIDLEELLAGKFPKELQELFTLKGQGLFPTSKEIHFDCTCPDWASMCKHVTAVLYGIGARFDGDPTLFFALRDIDFGLLLKKTIDQKMESMLKNAGKTSSRVLDDPDVFDLFGIGDDE
ncbi:MAG: hypothetical protein M0R49_06670 [Limnochordia bacterium]|jgi:uncharacterized Zn finger protein|nr:hypothetical protein [Limnochordia bacterium]